MKNHELLDLIGDVNEDYVQAADSKVIRPRFGWKKLAACAACAALVLGAYPVYRAVNPPQHGYTVLEGGGMTTLDDVKAPAGGESDPNALPGGAYVGGDSGNDGEHYQIGDDAPVDEAAADQYDKLLRGMGMHGEGAASYPDWFAGAWIDHSGGPDDPAWLTVAIVDGFRTPEREAEILGWCGDGVVFQDAKYSHAYLDGLMEQVAPLLDGTGLNCGVGVDVIANCLGIDLYSNGQAIPDSILARLAKLDPAGDAIRVRLFTGKLDTLTDDMVKGPAPAPVDPETRATLTLTDDSKDAAAFVENGALVPGGASSAEDLPQTKEAAQSARYDLLPLDE